MFGQNRHQLDTPKKGEGYDIQGGRGNCGCARKLTRFLEWSKIRHTLQVNTKSFPERKNSKLAFIIYEFSVLLPAILNGDRVSLGHSLVWFAILIMRAVEMKC